MEGAAYALRMSFGSRLAEARKRKNLTQEALGRGLGTDGKDASKAVIYGWEKDQHHPRADQLAMLCSRLDVSADWLLLGKGSESALTREALDIALEIDTFDAETRRRVLLMWSGVLALARGTPNEEEQHLTPVASKRAHK